MTLFRQHQEYQNLQKQSNTSQQRAQASNNKHLERSKIIPILINWTFSQRVASKLTTMGTLQSNVVTSIADWERSNLYIL